MPPATRAVAVLTDVIDGPRTELPEEFLRTQCLEIVDKERPKM